MANNNMTRKSALEIAIACCDNADAREVLEHMLEQISKPRKASTSKTPARVQNESLVQRLCDTVPAGETIDGAMVMTLLPEVMTPQKVVGVMRVAEELGAFARLKVGKRTMYQRLG